MNLTCFISIQQLLIVESVRVRVSPDQPRSLRAQTSPDHPRPLRAQTSQSPDQPNAPLPADPRQQRRQNRSGKWESKQTWQAGIRQAAVGGGWEQEESGGSGEGSDGEGTRAGLAPLTTGPGLPSNPWAPCIVLYIVREQRWWEEVGGWGWGWDGMGRWRVGGWVKLWLMTSKSYWDDEKRWMVQVEDTTESESVWGTHCSGHDGEVRGQTGSRERQAATASLGSGVFSVNS